MISIKESFRAGLNMRNNIMENDLLELSELPAIEMAGILLHSSDYCPQVHKLDPVFHR